MRPAVEEPALANPPARPIRVLELRSVRGTGGGPEKTILLGAARADRRRLSVTVCYVRDRRDRVFEIDRRAAAAGVDYVEILERHSFDPSVWPALRRLVRERRIDIVHSHDYKTDVLAYLLGKAESAVALSTVHGWAGDRWRERCVYYPLDMQLLRGFRRVIAVSGVVRQRLVDHGVDPSRIEVVWNGIDERTFRRDPARRQAARERFGIGPDEIVVGGVGRLEPLKRFDALVEAVAMLRSRYPELRLLIAGDGGARAALEAQIAALGATGVCRLVGQTGDVVEFHHALDVFVQSSATEASPNVILEAMALETPVVATAVGGTTELMRPDIDGLAVPRVDPGLLAGGIADVIENRGAARARAERARRRIERDLSFTARMDRVEAVYRTLVAASLRPLTGHHACASC
ncbi:MAG TPA: glycosyltransferase [Vicinamibacterales bacterium]|nr:glycosyltransferase [Vicinamibacterales bacterium]